MTPIPAAATPVVEILRRDVPRPSVLPRLKLSPVTEGKIAEYLRDPANQPYVLRWTRLPGDCLPDDRCPMGLHPSAPSSCPTSFPLASREAASTFLDWWDSQHDAQAAVDAVWGAS